MLNMQTLGKSGVEVSKLCFGSLTIGPLQANMPIDEGASVMAYGFEQGINFVDTAEIYDTYKYIKHAIEMTGNKEIVIATKSYAYDEKTAEASLKKACNELGRDYIDIFMLHEQESAHTLRGHYEALEYYEKMKRKGYIRALGLSTHFVKGVEAGNKCGLIDVIHPIINKQGLGIQDGTVKDMIDALKITKQNGIGVFAMKPFGGGNLLHSVEACMDFVLGCDLIDSVAIGMQSKLEVDYNVQYITKGIVADHIKDALSNKSRHLLIHDWCTKCGKCIAKCQHKALAMGPEKVIVDRSKCVLCGYCSAYCPDFCIKVV